MIYIKLLLTAVFWGGTFIAGRLIATSVHPVSAAFLRFAIASLCLFLLVVRKEGRLPDLAGNQIGPLLLLGLTGVFSYNILFFSGLQHIEAGRASLIIAINPIVISLLSAIIFKEALNWVKGLGICISVVGAMVVISKGQLLRMAGFGVGTGELLILGCVASWVSYTLIGKVVLARLSPLTVVAYSAFAGTLLLLIPALYSGLLTDIGHYSTLDWFSIVYLGFFGTVLGFVWYYQGIERIGPMKASVFINFVPISAMILSFFILHETLTLTLVMGGAMVIMGVYFTNASHMIAKLITGNRK